MAKPESLSTVEIAAEAESSLALRGGAIQEEVENSPSSLLTLLTTQVVPEHSPTTGLHRTSPECEEMLTVEISSSFSE